MSSKPKVGISILNWNQENDTMECLKSLGDLDYPNYEILLIDNGSSDGSAERIKARFPKINFIRNEENLGFAGGNNVGIKEALTKGADYVLLLNNDTKVDKGFLAEMVAVAEDDEKIGVVGAVNYYYHEPNKVWYSGGNVNWWRGEVKGLHSELINPDLKERFEVDDVAGSSLLIKKEVIDKIGYLDERFFALFEETDWCIQAKKAGYKVMVSGEAKIWHKVSRTLLSDMTIYFSMRNRALFMAKNASKKFLISFLFFYATSFSRAMVKFFAKRQFRLALVGWWGARDFLKGRLGKGSLEAVINSRGEKG